MGDVEADHPTLPAASRARLKAWLGACVDEGSIYSAAGKVLSDAVLVLAQHSAGGDVVAAAIEGHRGCELGTETPETLEKLQMILLAEGKRIDRERHQGNPLVLHCLALGKLAKAL